MLAPGERVAAGISGGADSVCLLFVLLEWKKKYGIELAAVHVNHGIRAEAAEDARYVEELCRQKGIPFYLREVDARDYAKREKCSEEEAGRILRYEAFEAVAEEFGADKIAVAHNLNDRAETMLFHLFRGSGLRGLAGISPVREDLPFGGPGGKVRIIRPLLCVERAEIEAFLARLGQEYCRDATNEEDDHTRNRIRHHILPYAEREIAGGCVRRMGSTAELLAETEDYLEQRTREALEACMERQDCNQKDAAGRQDCKLKNVVGRQTDGRTADVSEYRLNVGAFLNFHPALQKRMLHALIKSLSPGAKDISRVHVEDMRTLFTEEGNRKIILPFGICGRREYGSVLLERSRDGRQQPLSEADGAVPPERVLDGCEAEFSVLSAEDLPRNAEKTLIFPENEYTKWFDYDKIKKWPVLRTREAGDFLTIADGEGETRHKSLKSYMVTEKIPESRRGKIPVLAEDSHVLWLVGYRISQYYKITENTKRVLQVQLKKRCETEDKNGGTC